MNIKTRFAPSPTGYLHIGGARTALFSWLYARHHGGKFVLRIEDTDRERSTQESVDAILRGMEWLGMDYDEGPYYQTQRFDRYQEVIAQLLDEDKAYRCYCTKDELDALRAEQQKNKQKPRYDGRYRDYSGPIPSGIEPVIRFKNPLDGDVVINDQVLGQVVINNRELDDLIIARSDGTPTYNLTVVVDDLDMQISHVIRGDDHINNTPRQINLLQAIGGEMPNYAHLPMILGNDGKRMSKRHGAVSVSAWLSQAFTRKNIAHVNTQKLTMVAHIQKDRFKTINELIEQSEYFFLDELPAYDDKSVKKHFNSGTADLLTEISTGFQQLNDWKAEHIQSVIDQYIESSGLKLGKVAPPIRIAVTGSTNSPSIDITLELIGQPLVIKRLQSAIEFIKQNRLDQ